MYTSPYIIAISNFRKMRWARDAGLSHTQRDEKVIQCKLLIKKLKRRYQLLRTCVAGRIFKWIKSKRVEGRQLD